MKISRKFLKNCINIEICRKCTGGNRGKYCKSNVKQCINCIEYTGKYKISNWNVEHEAAENDCKIFKKMIKKKNRTMYLYRKNSNQNVKTVEIASMSCAVLY